MLEKTISTLPQNVWVYMLLSSSRNKEDNLDNKYHKGMFMGYSSSKGYRSFCLKLEKLILSLEVKFDKTTFWDWKNQKISYFYLISKEQPQLSEDELVDDVTVRETRFLKDGYKQCKLITS